MTNNNIDDTTAHYNPSDKTRRGGRKKGTAMSMAKKMRDPSLLTAEGLAEVERYKEQERLQKEAQKQAQKQAQQKALPFFRSQQQQITKPSLGDNSDDDISFVGMMTSQHSQHGSNNNGSNSGAAAVLTHQNKNKSTTRVIANKNTTTTTTSSSTTTTAKSKRRKRFDSDSDIDLCDD